MKKLVPAKAQNCRDEPVPACEPDGNAEVLERGGNEVDGAHERRQ
jgi:hypothetical protein